MNLGSLDRGFLNVGVLYMADSLYHQGKGQVDQGDRNVAYHYDLVEGKPFNRFNSEQQAEIIEEYVGLVEALIRHDVNPDFRSLDANAVRTTLEGP